MKRKITRCFTKIDRREILEKSKQCLWSGSDRSGLNYLRVERKLSDEAIKKFELGYVPFSANHQLAGRIIFPLFGPSGHLIALGSRFIGDKETGSVLPVYWHEAYEKSFYLYGVHLAKSSMRQWRFACLCEGQFDIIKMHDHGMTNAVALCGTSFSEIQLSIIYRYCEDIVVILDSDQNKTGQTAMNKIKKLAYESCAVGDSVHRSIAGSEFTRKIATLNLGEFIDPDDYIDKYGIASLKQLIKQKVRDIRGHKNT